MNPPRERDKDEEDDFGYDKHEFDGGEDDDSETERVKLLDDDDE